MDETTPALVSAQGARSRVSPDRRQKSTHYAPTTYTDSSIAESSFFQMSQASTSVSSRSSQRNFLDPTSRDFVAQDLLGSNSQRQYSRQNSGDDVPYNSRNGGFANPEPGLALPGRTTGSTNISGYNSSVGSRNGSLPPSRSDVDPSSRGRGEAQNYARYTANATAQRLNSVANAPPFIMHTGPSGQRMGEQHSPTHLDGLASQFDQLSVANQQRRPSYASSQPSPNSITDRFPDAYRDPLPGVPDGWSSDLNDNLGISDQLSPAPSSTGLSRQNQFRSAFNGQYSHSPSDSDARLSHHSPFYSANGTPPTLTHQNTVARGNYPSTSTQQAALLERRLQGLQQQQQGYIPQQTQMQFRNQIPFPYDINPQQYRMNNLNSYYPMAPAPHLLAGPQIPRGPARDHDMAGHLRSPLLEEFRNNSKTNKRYELKVGTTQPRCKPYAD